MRCSTCRQDKEPEEFNWKSKAAGKRAKQCKLCHKRYRDQHYLDNRSKRVQQAATRRRQAIAENQQFIFSYLSDKCCIDCGEPDPVVLEFDHRDPNEKRIGISSMLTFSQEAILAEIAKCDIRCANCHRRSTAKRFGYYRFNLADVAVTSCGKDD